VGGSQGAAPLAAAPQAWPTCISIRLVFKGETLARSATGEYRLDRKNHAGREDVPRRAS